MYSYGVGQLGVTRATFFVVACPTAHLAKGRDTVLEECFH